MIRKLKKGAVIEIETGKGLAYAQYVQFNQMYGYLIRVIAGFFDSRPENFDFVMSHAERFITFYAAVRSINNGRAHLVGQSAVPGDYASFPLFRSALLGFEGAFVSWWLWNGKEEWCVGKTLTPEQKELPLETGIWNHKMLVERIETEWRAGPDTYF